VNIYDGQGLTPLHWAVQSGSSEIVLYLLDNGAFVNTPEKNTGSTELHLAAALGYGDISEMLIENGSDITAEDFEGNTPMDYAWRYGHKQIAYDLLASGADDGHLKEMVNAPDRLKEDMNEGEAMVWFLGHSGWAVKTQNHFLVFDYFCDHRTQPPDDSCLSSGYIVPEELGYENVTVFCTHRHGDHYSEDIFTWREELTSINYVLCWNPPGLRDEYEYIPVHGSKEIDGMNIYVNYSTDLDGGYLVEVDGLTIWHMGDHANGEEQLMTAFTDEVDLIADRTEKIDILFGGIRGCSLGEPEQVKRGLYYTFDKLQPELFIPMHSGNHSYSYKEFVETAAAEGIAQEMEYPVHRGDFFIYKQETHDSGTTNIID
jgi:L-ascorbate metabolism protein UlaG (beta-lactamase superfamily)